MDKGAGGRAKRILSWILAALIITGGAIAIGWFAGIALVDLMEPGSKDLSDQMDDLNADSGGAVYGADATQGADEPSESEPQSPQLSLPSIMDEAFEQQDNGGESPFASPPWANNVSITPIDEAEADTADTETGQEQAAADAEDEPTQQAEQGLSEEPLANTQVQVTQQSPLPITSSQAAAPQSSAGTSASEPSQQPSQQVMYKVRVGPFADKVGADEAAVTLKEMGLPVLTIKEGTEYFVQVGAFSVWANADALMQKVKASGFSAKIAN